MKRTCGECGEEFVLLPNHVGFANRCLNCNCGVEEPERVGAQVIWTGKHTVELQIVSLSDARKFNRKNVRFGTSILSCIAQGQESGEGREALGMDNGATPGSQYTSYLREKRHLKR